MLVKPYLKESIDILRLHWQYICARKNPNMTGSVRKNQKGISKLISKLKIGQIENKHTRNMLVTEWKRCVHVDYRV